MPCRTVVSLLASVKTEPRMGPTHGVQPIAKVSPTAKEPMKPAGLLWMWSCWLRPKRPMRSTPAMYRPKITMRPPPAMRIQSR